MVPQTAHISTYQATSHRNGKLVVRARRRISRLIFGFVMGWRAWTGRWFRRRIFLRRLGVRGLILEGRLGFVVGRLGLLFGRGCLVIVLMRVGRRLWSLLLRRIVLLCRQRRRRKRRRRGTGLVL